MKSASNWIVLALVPCGLLGQTVQIRHGNIYLEQGGQESQLTETGRDSGASLSPDRTRIVFLRRYPATESREAHPVQHIMEITVAGGGLRTLHAGGVIVSGKTYFDFLGLQFAPDNRHVYFLLGDYGATTGAVVDLDAATGLTRFVTDGLSCRVVPSGPYAGDLVVKQRRPLMGTGYYFWIYLFSPGGKELGVIGETESDISNFFLKYLSDDAAGLN